MKGSEATARVFLNLMLMRDYDNAYGYLGSNLRTHLSQREFNEQAKRWSSQERHRWDLTNRRIEVENENSVRVNPGPDDRLDSAWHWRFARDDTGYYISYLEGGPLEFDSAGR